MPIFKVDQPIVLQEADGLWRDLRPNYEKIDIAKYLKFFIIPGEEKYGPQPYIMWDNGRKMRVRCEVILLDEKGRMLIKPNPSFKRLGEQYPYECPGGGIDKGESIEEAASRECKEEVRIIPENIKFTGIHYTYEVPNDSKEHWGMWGHISFVCVAMKGDNYTGYVAPIDREASFIKKITWVYPHEIDIIPAHEEAIRWYKQYYFNPIQEGSIPTDEYYVNRFISGQDVYVNWEKWTSGLMDKCFIIGMSGSGKSTLGSKLAQQFHCYCVHTDRFRGNVHYTDEQLFKEDPIIYRYFDTVWGLKNRFKIKDMSKDQRTQEFKKFIDWVLKQNDRIIIEGAVEKVLIKEPKLQQYPIIFKGTSMMKSMYRMVRRELIEKPTFYGAPISWILKFVTRYSDMRDLNNQARDSVMRHNPSYEQIHETVAPIVQWPPTHKQMCDIYERQCMMEASESRPVHQSGNTTQYRQGAYFDEDTNMWMRHPYPGETNSSPNSPFVEGGKSMKFNGASEFKPMQISTGYISSIGKDASADEDKYIGYFEADEKEWLKKIKYKVFQGLRKGKPQPVIYDDEGKAYRPRCEVIVIDGYNVLIDPTNDRGGFGYTLPGGGIDPSEDIVTGARRECEEEARVIPKHCVYTGLAWMLEFANPMFNNGSISFICIAERGRHYKGYVKVEDRDTFVDNAKWVDYRKFKLGEPHRIAIERFKDMQLKEEGIMDLDRSFLDAEYK